MSWINTDWAKHSKNLCTAVDYMPIEQSKTKQKLTIPVIMDMSMEKIKKSLLTVIYVPIEENE